LKLPQGIVHGVQIDLHGRRGLCPVLWSKGKRPDGVGGLRQRFHDVSSRYITGLDCGTFIAEVGDWVQRKMFEERDTEHHDLRLPQVVTL
jgi:hypothetical protein